jgi:5-methylcytosine-specific restriction enzyme subunit McrC
MHALCRFFLDQTGPGHTPGNRAMLPFLVDMARLFELFVVEWLRVRLPAHLELKEQETVNLNPSGSLHFRIDISLYEKTIGLTRCVLDTKYKTGPPAAADIAQVMAYAQVKGCNEAILVYPTPPPHPLDEVIGGIRIRSLTFGLAADLEQAGEVFLQSLLVTTQPTR